MTTDSLQRLCDVHYFAKECMVANKEHPSSILRRTEGNQKVFATVINFQFQNSMGTATKTLTNKWFNKPSNDWTYFRAKYLVCKNYLLYRTRPRFTGEIWKLKTGHYILRLGLPSTIFRQKKKSKTLFKLEKFEHACFSLSRGLKTFLKKNFLKRTIWFPWPSFSQIKTQYSQWLLHF